MFCSPYYLHTDGTVSLPIVVINIVPVFEVVIHFGNDGGLNEALEEESFKQLQICWVIHFITGIQ